MAVLLFPGDDAREAVKHGLNGILVSNHGARQLDGVPATVSFSKCWDFPLEFSFPSQFLHVWLFSEYFGYGTLKVKCVQIDEILYFKFSDIYLPEVDH